MKIESPTGSELTFAREDAEIVTDETRELWTLNLTPTEEATEFTVTADYDLADLCTTDEITVYAEKPADPPQVISVNTKTPAPIGEMAQVEVTVTKSPLAIRFIESTVTSVNREDAVITENEDGTETWTVNLLVKQEEQRLIVFAKDENGWAKQGKEFNFKAKETDKTTEIKNFEFEESLDGVIYHGVNEITLTTADSIKKVQFMQDGNTWTYSEDNAQVTEADGEKQWTIRMNFCNLGDNSYDVRVRTSKTSFEFSQKLDVTVYSR